MSSFPILPPIDPNQRYAIEQANLYLRQSRAKTYKDIAAGTLRVIKDGSRVYVPGTEIIRRSTLSGSPEVVENGRTHSTERDCRSDSATARRSRPR